MKILFVHTILILSTFGLKAQIISDPKGFLKHTLMTEEYTPYVRNSLTDSIRIEFSSKSKIREIKSSPLHVCYPYLRFYTITIRKADKGFIFVSKSFACVNIKDSTIVVDENLNLILRCFIGKKMKDENEKMNLTNDIANFIVAAQECRLKIKDQNRKGNLYEVSFIEPSKLNSEKSTSVAIEGNVSVRKVTLEFIDNILQGINIDIPQY
jgi:hypothetical protein